MALIFYIKVTPGSRKVGWTIDSSGMLKCFVAAPPEKGLANKEVIKQLAQALSIPKSDIEIIAGSTARIKKVKVRREISFETLIQKLKLKKE